MKHAFRIFTVAIIAFGVNSAQARKEVDAPSSWGGWKSSTAKGDAEIVKRIQFENSKFSRKTCIAFGSSIRAKNPSRYQLALIDFISNEPYLINGIDLSNISSRGAAEGMTICGVFASLGEPDAINNTTSKFGTRSQIVYRSKRMYVYTQNQPGSPMPVVTTVQW